MPDLAQPRKQLPIAEGASVCLLDGPLIADPYSPAKPLSLPAAKGIAAATPNPHTQVQLAPMAAVVPHPLGKNEEGVGRHIAGLSARSPPYGRCPMLTEAPWLRHPSRGPEHLLCLPIASLAHGRVGMESERAERDGYECWQQ